MYKICAKGVYLYNKSKKQFYETISRGTITNSSRN
jgi:hypothetical protein